MLLKLKVKSFILTFLLLFCMLTVTAFAYTANTYRGSVRLGAADSSVTSSQYSGTYGRGKVYNNSGSAGSTSLSLQISSGTSWKTYTTITAAAGSNNSTNDWGRANTDYLFRVVVKPTSIPIFGNPGCIAIGYVYTD